jgi:hypothetical protein
MIGPNDSWNRRAAEVRPYRGEIVGLKFVERLGKRVWVAGKDGNILDPENTYIVGDCLKVWARIVKGEPIQHQADQPGKPFPVRSELPDQDKTKWKSGRSGKPVDPWTVSEHVFLAGQLSGEGYTVIARYNERRAVDDLCDAIVKHRIGHPNAVAVIKLSSKQFGDNPVPHFEIVGWLNDEPGSSPAPQPLPLHPKAEQKRPKPQDASAEFAEMNDEIPF